MHPGMRAAFPCIPALPPRLHPSKTSVLPAASQAVFSRKAASGYSGSPTGTASCCLLPPPLQNLLLSTAAAPTAVSASIRPVPVHTFPVRKPDILFFRHFPDMARAGAAPEHPTRSGRKYVYSPSTRSQRKLIPHGTAAIHSVSSGSYFPESPPRHAAPPFPRSALPARTARSHNTYAPATQPDWSGQAQAS